MIIPALGMSWALVGRAESAADAAKGGTGYDVYGLIIIHLLLIAPATANCLAKFAHGQADDALGCIALALNPEAKLIIAPAMNGKMWSHPATQANVGLLRERGAQFIGPAEGELACGYEGLGRLETPDAIAEAALQLLGIPS